MTEMTTNMARSYTLGAFAIGGLLLILAEEAHVQHARADELEGENRVLAQLVNQSANPPPPSALDSTLDITDLYAACTQDLYSCEEDTDMMVSEAKGHAAATSSEVTQTSQDDTCP